MAIEGLAIRLLRSDSDMEEASDDLWKLLVAIDRDFVPPLSSRTNTTEHELTQEVLWGGPISFFETVMHERALIGYIDDKAVGMLTFIPHYSEPMLANWSPSTYASTVGVLPRYRRKGIASALNDALDDLPDDLASPWITRRTWSTNTANLSLLLKRGFEIVVRMKDHRGPGVDTIYLARPTRTQRGGHLASP
jgi:ribosomal protein S18 acetylase RimI-like enzyme